MHFLSLFGWNIGFYKFLFQESHEMVLCKCDKGSDLFPIIPHCLQLLQPSVSNVIMNGEDLWEDTLYIMLNFIIFLSELRLMFKTFNMQLCNTHMQYSICQFTSTACPGTVFALLFIIPVNFISFTCLHVVSRDFPEIRSTKCAQIQFISIISASTPPVQYRMV